MSRTTSPPLERRPMCHCPAFTASLRSSSGSSRERTKAVRNQSIFKVILTSSFSASTDAIPVTGACCSFGFFNSLSQAIPPRTAALPLSTGMRSRANTNAVRPVAPRLRVKPLPGLDHGDPRKHGSKLDTHFPQCHARSSPHGLRRNTTRMPVLRRPSRTRLRACLESVKSRRARPRPVEMPHRQQRRTKGFRQHLESLAQGRAAESLRPPRCLT